MKILILFGPPFSGKGTQGELLARKLQYKHISTGELLRKEKELNSEMGIIAQEYSKKGLLVPDDLLEKLVDRELKANFASKGIILDGYPRTIPQAETLFKLSTHYQVHIQKVIFLQVNEAELILRGVNRGLTSNREDDQNPEVMKKRIDVYHSETQPVADFYAKMNLVAAVDGQGDSTEITARIIESITSL
jgi:adenylate kinase